MTVELEIQWGAGRTAMVSKACSLVMLDSGVTYARRFFKGHDSDSNTGGTEGQRFILKVFAVL